MVRLDEAQGLIEELFERASVEVDEEWVVEFLEDDNGCKITCSDCGQASRLLALDVSRDRTDLEAALASAAKDMGGRFEAGVSVADTDFFDAWLEGQSGREYLASIALSQGTVEVQLFPVCYI